MKAKWLDRSLIVGPFVALVINEDQFHAAMNDCGIPKGEHGEWIKTDHSDATVHFLVNKSKERCCIVAIRVKKKTDPNSIIGLLVHESVHIWQNFKEGIGEGGPSDEFEAYSIQAISQRLICAYSELSNSRTKKKKQ